MKINFLETSSPGKTIVPYASAGAVTKDIMDFVVSPVNWILARDTSYPIIQLNQCDGENEVTFRQRYR